MNMFLREIITERIILAAIGSITILELVALMCGVDGTLFALVLAIIAGLAGFKVGGKV